MPNKNCEWPKVFVLKFYECDYFEAIYTRSFIAFAISYDATFTGFVWSTTRENIWNAMRHKKREETKMKNKCIWKSGNI